MTRDAGVGCDYSKRTDGEAPTELPTAQHKNNLSSVPTEMSAGCSGGLEVSTADQYSQDPRFKTKPSPLTEKKNLHVKHFCNRV
jgi:hypothetical protein